MNSILQTLCPTEEEMEHVRAATKDMQTLLLTAATKYNLDVEITPGGSTAKGTNLAGNFDIDMFIRFKTPGKLDDLLEKLVGELNIPYERVHGSRDYFTLTFQNFFFELVPVKYVTACDAAENVTDMSPLHVHWAKEHLTPKLANDIRLAKQFCKAAKVYGAESYINGVSGHVLDILIIYYNGFENFLEAVSNWHGTTIIDPETQHQDVMQSMNQSKLDSPLIVVDPVDPARNAAAALSAKNYNILIKAAKHYLATPSAGAFQIHQLSIEELIAKKQTNDELFVLQASPLDGKKDVVYTKLLKIFEFLQRHLQLAEFTIRKSGWEVQEGQALMYFFTDASPLENEYIRQGPPAAQEKDVARFREANAEAFEQNGFWCVVQQREYVHVREYLEKLLGEEFVTSRSKKIKLTQH